MKISVITLFPELIKTAFAHSILGRAQKKGLVEYSIVDLRHFGIGSHKTVDDRPYGGGSGMVLKVDVVVKAIENTTSKSNKELVILMCPQGEIFSQEKAEKLTEYDHIVLVSGHYEGFDERIREYVDLEISVGDYVLTGGEFPAIIVADSVTRLIPGVLSEGSAEKETLANTEFGRILEGPQYTRPEEFEGKIVPNVYLSGDPKIIEEYKTKSALQKTARKRPDLLKGRN